MKTLVLTAADLRELVEAIGLDDLLLKVMERLRTGLSAARSGAFQSLPRAGFFDTEPVTGLLEWMPGRDGRRTTVKIVGYHPDNPASAKPTILSVAALFDNDTGHMAALADATFLTALRTGAASAVATDVLAREDAEVLGLIGCGAQAVSQLHAISKVRRIQRVLLYDVDHAVEDSFPARIAPLGLDVAFEPTPIDSLAASCDILVTCTSVAPQAGPVFQPTDHRPGLHINAVGSDFPGKTEVPRTLLERAFICADYPAQCLEEGECQQLDADAIDCDLPELWARAEEFRPRRSELTVFDSTGWALEDHFALEVIVEKATEFGLGSMMEIEAAARDPYDPYGFLNLRSREPQAAGELARTKH